MASTKHTGETRWSSATEPDEIKCEHPRPQANWTAIG